MSESEVRRLLQQSIREKRIVRAKYDHVGDNKPCEHFLAPIDIGIQGFKATPAQKQTLCAYSFTRRAARFFKLTQFRSIEITASPFNPDEVLRAVRRELNSPSIGMPFYFCSERV